MIWYDMIYCNVFIWETTTWFMFLDIEITCGFHPLQVFASIDVLIMSHKVHAESAIAIFVLFVLLTRCRRNKVNLNCALKLLQPRQITPKRSSWEKREWMVRFSISQSNQILSYLLFLKLWLPSIWLSTSSCTSGNTFKMLKRWSKFSLSI